MTPHDRSTRIVQTNEQASHLMHKLAQVEAALVGLVDDKHDVIEVSLCALLTSGHVLLEDVPGVGKTTFLKALAKLLDLEMNRIQFTSDLMPADIIGVEVFDPKSQQFVFHRGPIFTRILLADELNRASPRTQSALLEAMGEGHVTEGLKSYPLPRPFVVFASQNPRDSLGTYELPDSQLDRFAARIKMGYPSTQRELAIFQAAEADPLQHLPQGLLSMSDLASLQAAAEHVHVSARVAQYAKRIVDASRANARLRQGISTRGGVTWIRMAKARAAMAARNYLTPDDLQRMAVPCLTHRVLTASGVASDVAIQELLQTVEVS